MLRLSHLKKYYATQKAVDDVSFQVQEGGIFGLLGPNGAGKSSILRMVTGITLPDSGTIYFAGEEQNNERHASWIGYMPEERGLYKKMKIGEQALYLAQLKGMSRFDANKQIKAWFEKLEMMSWWNKKVEDLSKGMSQKLQFVTTVIHQPRLLILDEPFSGLDPVNSEVIKEEIYLLAKQGTTVIFSTHRMEQVEEICKDIVLIHKGKVVLDGSVQEIRNKFKKNQFFFKTSDTMNFAADQILKQTEEGYILNLENLAEAQSILKKCLNQNIEIRGFEELLPGLNEIFIQAVDGQAARSFEKPENV